jgi:uncharacterized membrane protein YoaK (UPF0700 family)
LQSAICAGCEQVNNITAPYESAYDAARRAMREWVRALRRRLAPSWRHDCLFAVLSDGSVMALLAFASGFIDAGGYIALHGLFTSNMTGNVVVAGSAVSGNEVEVLSRLVVVPAFLGGCALCAALSHWLRAYRRHPPCLVAAACLTLEAVLLVAVWGFGLGFQPALRANPELNGWPTVLVGCITAVAMGSQSGLTGSLGPLRSFGGSTVVMTTTMTQWAAELMHTVMILVAGYPDTGHRHRPRAEVHAAASRAPNAPAPAHHAPTPAGHAEWVASRDRLVRLSGTLIFFFGGAAAGAASMSTIGYWGTPIGLGIVTLLAADAWAACWLHGRATARGAGDAEATRAGSGGAVLAAASSDVNRSAGDSAPLPPLK